MVGIFLIISTIVGINKLEMQVSVVLLHNLNSTNKKLLGLFKLYDSTLVWLAAVTAE